MATRPTARDATASLRAWTPTHAGPAPAGEGLLPRITLATLAAVALVGLAAGLVGGEIVSFTAHDATARRASLLAVSTAARMRPLGPRARATLARELSDALASPVTVLGPDGVPLPGAPPSPLPPTSDLLGTAHSLGDAPLDGHDAVFATERASTPEGAFTLVVAMPLAGARASAAGVLLALGLALVVTAALGVVGSLVVARDIATDVRSITARARAMARGYAAALRPLPVRTGDEVGRLVAAFNRLQRRFGDEVALHRDALARLEDNERRKETLLATLRHELRTPLNSILGFADLLLSGVDGELLPAQRDDVTLIARSGAHLLRLVDDVLDLSAMASGRYPLAREPADLVALAHEVVAEAEGIARTRGVTVALTGLDRAEIYGDPVALRRALTNLVVNAIEHAGGAVTVSVSVASRGRGIAVAVGDNGPGIAARDLRRLFKPFERGRTAEARGAGLGLAITLGLVELHGGTLSAHSEVGRGSTFTVTLPAGMAPLPPASAVAPREGP